MGRGCTANGEEHTLDRPLSFTYEIPAIVETFDALEVMGSADGLETIVGCGSNCSIISVAR
jgi:hypothetical protein